MNERQRRIGENEAVFRSVNEQIQGLSATLSTATDVMGIVCECGVRSCTDKISVRPDEYSRIREDPTLFFVKPGHDLPEAETVVDRTDTYWIVRKDPGGPAELARATDPRS